jgi:hypothetical protein
MPSTQEGALTERQQFWQGHLQRCETEGLSVRAYAEANGLSASAMRSAKRGFKDRARARDGVGHTPGALTLVPVMARTVGRAATPAMQLYLPGGVRAEVSAEAASAVTAALLRTVLEVGR